MTDDTKANEQDYYTREGDQGQTRLAGHGPLSKLDPLVAAYAECDEANAAVSVAMAMGGLPDDIVRTLSSVQNDIFDVQADLAVPNNEPAAAKVRIVQGHIERLERAIDHYARDASDLSGMVLPGGTVAAALLGQARAVVRRTERATWAAVEKHPQTVGPMPARYMNRLSSLLFVLGRGANAEHGDVTWVPGLSVSPPEGDTDVNPVL
ncbi:cob(I)yrinic acid a,c-diamide adenosyltransferase [Arthrobacter castelli]|uniref:cob(I)yrinic acid a,c-diamide adenosyltransferase n=1 Tax=Arthrobacter castelli TaxID=271431 RepID=UPI00041BEDC5|nr:cob(I)yrinic acid a,c-diamide adenosyltransferase [Arthrobacter castelli]